MVMPVSPHSVNGKAIVVGEADQRAFVWSKPSGGFLLDTLLARSAPQASLRRAVVIGDGGHIIAETQDLRLVLLTPSTEPSVGEP